MRSTRGHNPRYRGTRMKKGWIVALLLLSLSLPGCSDDRAEREAKAVEVAKRFDADVLDYSKRPNGEVEKGFPDATARAQQSVKEQLLSLDEMRRNTRGSVPEVQAVQIANTVPLGEDGADGFIVNTKVSYNWEAGSDYHAKVGLVIIPDGEVWKVDRVEFAHHLDLSDIQR